LRNVHFYEWLKGLFCLDYRWVLIKIFLKILGAQKAVSLFLKTGKFWGNDRMGVSETLSPILEKYFGVKKSKKVRGQNFTREN